VSSYNFIIILMLIIFFILLGSIINLIKKNRKDYIPI